MIVRLSLHEQVRQAILDEIGAGKLQPGDRIVEARLAEQFGVSAIPIREAIRELVAMRVLDFTPHCGARVRQVSLAETIDALEVRAALDPLIARLAVPRLRGRCEALRAMARAIVAAARSGDLVEFQRQNQHFHRSLAEASGNPSLLRTFDSLAFEIRTRVIMELSGTLDPLHVAREHQQIVDAVDQGDVEGASALMVAHTRVLIEQLRVADADTAGGDTNGDLGKRPRRAKKQRQGIHAPQEEKA